MVNLLPFNVRREPHADFCVSVSTARLGGKGPRSQIFGRQADALCDSGKHSGSYIFAIVKCKDEISPTRTGKSFV